MTPLTDRAMGLLTLGALSLVAGCGGGGGGGASAPMTFLASGATVIDSSGGAGGSSADGGGGGGLTMLATDGADLGGSSAIVVPARAIPRPGAGAFVPASSASPLTLADYDNVADDLDPATDRILLRQDIVIPAGKTLALSFSTSVNEVSFASFQGGVFVEGAFTNANTDPTLNIPTVTLQSLHGPAVIAADVTFAGRSAAAGQSGGVLSLRANQAFVASGVTIDLGGGTGLAGAGGGGGAFRVGPGRFGSGAQEMFVVLGTDTHVVAKGGNGLSGAGGTGGSVTIRTLEFGAPTTSELLGSIDASGGNGGGASGAGGLSFGVDALASDVFVAGEIKATGGAGAGSGVGGKGGDVTLGLAFGPGVSGAARVHLCGAAASGVATLRARGGAGGAAGGAGGGLRVISDEGSIRGTVDAEASGGAGGTGAGGQAGAVRFNSFGPRGFEIALRGTIQTRGGGSTSGDGGGGGDVSVAALDGPVSFDAATIDTSGGGATGGNRLGGAAGTVSILVDTQSPIAIVPNITVDPNRGRDGIGGAVLFDGTITARGGAGAGTGNGGAGGDVFIDSDPEDQELSTNGGGTLTAGSTIGASGGAGGGGGGLNGSGGSIVLRGSARSGVPATVGGFTNRAGLAALTSSGFLPGTIAVD